MTAAKKPAPAKAAKTAPKAKPAPEEKKKVAAHAESKATAKPAARAATAPKPADDAKGKRGRKAAPEPVKGKEELLDEDMGDVEAEGVRNSLTEMYKGFSRKADLLTQANSTLMAGKRARTGSYLGAAGTLLQGAAAGAGNYVRMK